ncbi:MAG: hypothetical protein ACRDY6_13325 [Acidimicrobiia bacterium]
MGDGYDLDFGRLAQARLTPSRIPGRGPGVPVPGGEQRVGTEPGSYAGVLRWNLRV